MGVACLEAGDFTAASRCFDQALEARSDFSQALILRGWANLKAAQREQLDASKRKELLESAYEDFHASWGQTRSAKSAASLAYCIAQKGNNPVDAKFYFREAVELGLSTPALLNNLGYFLTKTKDFVEAAEVLGQATQLDPTLQATHHNLQIAECRLASEAFLRADVERASGREEDAAKYEAQAGGHFQSAMEHIESWRQLKPRSAQPELAAARVYALKSTRLMGNPALGADAREQELLEKALRSCQAAVELHLPPNELKEIASLAPKLRKNPGFQSLMKKSPASVAAAPATLLVDVYPDIRDRLLDIGL